jgi:hypothetical protein
MDQYLLHAVILQILFQHIHKIQAGALKSTLCAKKVLSGLNFDARTSLISLVTTVLFIFTIIQGP